MNRIVAGIGGALVGTAVTLAIVASVPSGSAYVPTAHDADVNRDTAINSSDLANVAKCFGFNPATAVPCNTPTPTLTPSPVPTATNTPTGNNPTPNDPQYPTQWNLQKIRAPLAWEFGHGSSSIRVALLDTGVAPLADLTGNLGAGINTIDGGTTNDDFGSYGSGTQAASVIGAVGNNARDLAGVNWTVTVLPVKVCRYDGSCPTSAIVSGIDWATNNNAQIIQISFAVTPDASIDAAVQRALDAGLIVIAASGNNAGHVGYPASIAGVIAVGSTDSSDVVGAASGRGPQLSLTAPGVLVPVLVSGGCCLSKSDTSLAAAHVSGAIALMLSLGISNPVSRLTATAIDLGAAGRDDVYGAGRIDLYSAIISP